jgi:hypothetical protein
MSFGEPHKVGENNCWSRLHIVLLEQIEGHH